MLSPDSLALVGSAYGVFGRPYAALVAIAAVGHLLTIYNIRQARRACTGQGDPNGFFKAGLGPVPALALSLAGWVPLAICAGTVLLATAGYAFNETFVRSFPNLGFSFTLLLMLLIIGLLHPRAAMAFQLVAVLLAMAGLLVLSLRGLLWGQPPAIVSAPDTTAAGYYLFGAMGILIGYDLVCGASVRLVTTDRSQNVLMFGTVLAGAAILALWGWVSALVVAPQRLADTTIAYALAGRAIWGETGRAIIAVVVIAGSCAAVNALLTAIPVMLVRFGSSDPAISAGDSSPQSSEAAPGRNFHRSEIQLRTLRVGLGLGIGTMMAIGMAGEPAMAVYARSGVSLWLLYYAVLNLAVLMVHRARIGPLLGFVAAIGAAIGLVRTDDDPGLMLQFIVVILVVAFAVSLAWHRLSPAGKVAAGLPADSKGQCYSP